MRVLVAEDSSTVRALLVAILQREPDIDVIGQAQNGVEAVEMTVRLRPDVVTMDVHMPLLSGLDATKEIMATAPTPIVIVSASANDPEVALALSAVRAGALMVLPTPAGPEHPQFDRHAAEFVANIRAMAQVKVVRHRQTLFSKPTASRPPRRAGAHPVEVLAIAASTGGPAALHQVLHDLPRDFPVPIVIVQHIARGFVDGLCTWLNTSCDLRVKIAEQGEALAGRTVFIAPDDAHLRLQRGSIDLTRTSPVRGFRPSADQLFESAAEVYGSGAAALMLTGMGSDGVHGLAALHAAGGYVMAQDEATSVVFGMPGEAVRAGLVDAVLPLDRVAQHLSELTRGSRDDA